MGLAYLGFISLGLPDGLHGVAWPSMSAGFGVPLGAVGYVIAMSTTGYVLSSVTAGFLLARMGVGALLAGSTALSGLGLTGYAFAPSLVFVMAAALVLGLGSGAIDSGLNAYAAARFSARHMNWLHASFGFGAMMGPLVMTVVLSASLSWRWGYGIVAVALACLSLAFTASRRAWQGGNPATAAEVTQVKVGSSFRIPAVWLGVATFGVYTGLEIAAGLWAYTMLTDARGLAPATAGICVSAYWGALFAGRLLLGAIGDRVTPDSTLWAATIGLGLGALMLIPPSAVLSVTGLILIGFAAAPVFPMLTLTTAQRVGQHHADRAVGLQMGSAGLFGTLLPAGVGVLIQRYGGEALGPALVVLTAVFVGLHVMLTLSARRLGAIPS
jgi:fucose permease